MPNKHLLHFHSNLSEHCDCRNNTTAGSSSSSMERKAFGAHLQECCNGAEAVPEVWRKLWKVFALLAELKQRVFTRGLVAELVHILFYV
jgi:hypothetical protein